MAELRNDAGALRFALELSGREAAPPSPPQPGAPAGGRLLASSGLEYLDRRDGEWWPLVRLPVLYLDPRAAGSLVADVVSFVRGAAPGFAWRPEDDPLVALQLGALPGGAMVEIGIDLGAFLAEMSGAPRRPQAELALFRFRAMQADLVRFSDALVQELEVLRR